jgi:hypothetical protein
MSRGFLSGAMVYSQPRSAAVPVRESAAQPWNSVARVVLPRGDGHGVYAALLVRAS